LFIINILQFLLAVSSTFAFIRVHSRPNCLASPSESNKLRRFAVQESSRGEQQS